MKVTVLGGGNSVERDISLRSAHAVETALMAAGFEVVFIDMASEDALSQTEEGSIVFPILHGAGGEDGSIQAELEHRHLPYLGADSKASRICFDKWLTREELIKAHLPVAQGYEVTANTYNDNPIRNEPHVLKAVGGGSSIGTLMVREPARVEPKAVDAVFAVSDRAVVEKLVEGIEITVPILDNQALPVIEIQLPSSEEFDFANKYNGRTQEICPPKSLDQQLQVKAQEIGEQTHRASGCRHLSRVDMIVKPDGSFVILEINTIPGLTEQSLYPKSALAAGMTMSDLMKRFVKLISRDYGLAHV